MVPAAETQKTVFTSQAELKPVLDHPELLLKVVTPLQGRILRILFYSENAITARQLQKAWAKEEIETFVSHFKPHTKQEKKGIANLIYSAISSDEFKQIFEAAIKAKRKIPGHPTLMRALDSLQKQGFLTEMQSDSKREGKLYTIAPPIYAILKEKGVFK